MNLPFYRPQSLAARLILAVLAVEAAFAVFVILLSYGYERHTHFRSFDVMLRGRADSVLGAVEDSEDVQDNVMLNQADLGLPPDDLWQATDDTGRLLGRSPNWPGPPASPDTDRHGNLRLDQNHRHYQILVLHGIRTTDPLEPGSRTHHITVWYGAPTDPVWRAIHTAVEFYASGSLLLLAVTGPLIAWLLRRGLAPLRTLATQASRVSANSWQFTPPPEARATPEFAPLTLALEQVLARLEQAFLQQRQFVSDAAHELKTAVAVSKSSLQLLQIRPRSVDEYKAGLARCLADTARLEDLVAQMLTLARVEATRPHPPEPTRAPATNPSDLIRRVVAHLEPLATLRDVPVELFLDLPSAATLPLDPEDAFILLTNLLLNALQHSPAAHPVQLHAAAAGDTLTLTVQDHGDGIDPETLPHVFERFYRGDPSRTRATGGAGLGLAIAKAIVDRAGGSIALASAPGRGATVSVHLPLAASAPSTLPAELAAAPPA